MRMKDEYIRCLEEEWGELEAQGIPTERAYELAGARAFDRLRDRLAAKADWLRQQEKES